MAILKSQLDTNTDTYRRNVESMTLQVKQLFSLQNKLAQGGGKALQAKQHERGKLFVRDRIQLLLDKEVPFLELSPLAGYELYEEEVPAGGIVTGIGRVEGRDCMIIANDPTVKGGTYYPITIKKHLRAQKIAEENNLPCIYLVDSGGANLPYQDEVFPDKEHFGRIFYNQARMSSQGIAQIAVVLGSCTAGGAYIPAMADESIMVKNQATIFLAGPPLVKAALGEEVTEQELGGADVHCKISGVADHYAENEEEALFMARECIKHLTQSITLPFSLQETHSPHYDIKEIYGLIPSSSKIFMDAKEIIARLIDNSDFHEFKAKYGTTLICGFGFIHGVPIGILANNGVLFTESAQKGTHFIELCCQRKIPLLFLQNITGFMVGKREEMRGIAKEGAKMVHAVACANVPKLTVIVGGSFGAGNYAMCGRAFDPRFLWMWPNARISVMGGEQAASVLAQVKKAKEPISLEAENEFIKSIALKYDKQGHSYYSSARLWDDGIIDPAATRDIVARALRISLNKPIPKTEFGIFRI